MFFCIYYILMFVSISLFKMLCIRQCERLDIYVTLHIRIYIIYIMIALSTLYAVSTPITSTRRFSFLFR